ncbi:MAG TPA: H/ACA RNA-protein complex protein Gar1 [Methanomicrobia archaeon]|nr:H/ACA RNA-protein complex protein Gar1 [Methanomicrobia archaeon]
MATKGKRLGTVLHVLNDQVIVRSGKLNIKRVLNATVVTAEKQQIGTVYDVFGPVGHPYVSIKVFASVKREELPQMTVFLR